MLLQFSVNNFRSFRTMQSLSLVASKGSELRDSNTFEVSPSLRLARSAVIYGPNAGGKSNLIKAFYFFQQFILHSATQYQEKQAIPLHPFRLDPVMLDRPSEFSIDFICGGTHFNYQIALDQNQIVREELYAFPKKYRQAWFTRTWNSSANQYDWYYGPNFKGEHKAWEQVTRANALYLSTAVQFNSEQLRPLFLWFRDQLVILPRQTIFTQTMFNPDLTLQFLKDSSSSSWIHKFMECADIGIEGFLLNEQDGPAGKKTAVLTAHKIGDSNQKTHFDLFQDESDGTQKLFLQAGGWFKSLREGLVLCVDELDISLHSKIVRYLVTLFHDSKTNVKNGQLLFTTHDTSLLDADLFRRDQIWFLEKDNAQGSHLYSLLDFKPRKNEALGKGYLQGRYGALPFPGTFRFV